MKIIVADEGELITFAGKLAHASQKLVKGQNSNAIIIYLQGSLGAGKTTLARGFLQGLGYQGRVKSPTYTLVESYRLQSLMINHFDFYRLTDLRELDAMGIQEYFSPRSIALIEWPDIGEKILGSPDVACRLKFKAVGREIDISVFTETGKLILKALS